MTLNYAKNLKKWSRGTLFCSIFNEKTVIRGIVMGHVGVCWRRGWRPPLKLFQHVNCPLRLGGVLGRSGHVRPWVLLSSHLASAHKWRPNTQFINIMLWSPKLLACVEVHILPALPKSWRSRWHCWCINPYSKGFQERFSKDRYMPPKFDIQIKLTCWASPV